MKLIQAQKLGQVIRRCDIFGQEVKLLAEGKYSYQTNIGAIMTLLLFSLIAYSSSSFIQDMNKGTNAHLNQKDVSLFENEVFHSNTYQEYNFEPNKFAFAVGIVDAFGKIIPNDNNEIFNVTFYYCTKYWNQTNCNYIPSVPCGTVLDEMSYDYNVTTEFRNVSHCLNPKYLQSIQNLTFQGHQAMNTFTVIGALASRCQNTTTEKNCAPEETIAKYLKNSYVYYTYTTFEFSKEFWSIPYSKQQNTEISVLFENTIKYIKVYQRYSVTKLEYNPFYFFPDIHYEEAIQYEQTLFDQALNQFDNPLLADISIRLSAKKQLCFIQYQTLMDVTAKVGGLYTILKLLFHIILIPLQAISYKLYLINFLIEQQFGTGKQDSPPLYHKKISFSGLLTRTDIRHYFREESLRIDKLLTITAILSNPIRISRQVENLQGSLRKIDTPDLRHGDDLIIDYVQSIDASPRIVNNEIQAHQVLTSKVKKSIKK